MTPREIAERAGQVSGLNPAFIYAQMAHETDGFSSPLCKEDYNYGGITSTKRIEGMEQPESPNSGVWYKHFNSDEEFADYYGWYLSQYKENGIYNATNIDEWATALCNGGYFPPQLEGQAPNENLNGYIAGMKRWSGTPDIGQVLHGIQTQMQKDPYDVPKEVKEELPSEGELFWDKFQDSLYDGAAWGAFRTYGKLRDTEADPNFNFTQEMIDDVQKQLGGDYAATLFVCQNAKSPEQMLRLINMKKEDLERRKRIEESTMGWSTAGTIMGMVFDPLNYVPVFGAGSKALGASKVARAAKMGFSTGALAVADRALAEKFSGYEQDYNMALLVGAAAGSVLPAAMELVGKGVGKAGEKIVAKAAAMENAAKMLEEGKTRLPNEILHDTSFIEKMKNLHDTAYGEAAGIKADQNVFALSKEDAKSLLAEARAKLPDKAKAFYDKATGTTVLIKDNIKDVNEIPKILLHEKGAHGLDQILSPEAYEDLMDKVRYNAMHNSSPAWKRAVQKARSAGMEDPEDILGYLAEELKPSNKFMAKLKKDLDKSLNALGVKGRTTDEEFLDIMRRAAENTGEARQGYRVLEDGSAVMHDFHYSMDNFVNPAHVDAALNVGRSISTWGIFANPWTVTQHSVSQTLNRLGKRLLQNPHMDEVLDEVPIESIKNQILGQCNGFYNEYNRLRQQYCVNQMPVFGRFSTSMKQDFNRQVWQYYNYINAHNTSGHVQLGNVPQEVIQAANNLKSLREYMIDTMRNTDRLFGNNWGRKMLPDTWQNFDDELWRLIDTTRRASFVSRFPDLPQAIDWLTDYAERAAKRDVIRQQIEHRAQVAYQEQRAIAIRNNQPIPPPPQPLTQMQLDAEVSRMAREWATGVVDQNASNRHLSNVGARRGDGGLEFMQHRMPMDTSLTIQDPLLGEFSFDGCLRSYDFDNTVPFMLNRFAGEVSVSNLFSHANVTRTNALGVIENFTDNVAELRRTVESELQQAVNAQQMSRADMNKEMKCFDYMMNKVRGIATTEDPTTRAEAFAQTLQSMSYARNGANMGFNQIAEISGTLAYEGFSAIADMVPAIGRRLDDIRMGRGANDMLHEAVYDMFGDDAYRYLWHNTNSVSSDVFQRIGNNSSFLNRQLDNLNGAVRAAATTVSMVNGLPKLTETMIRSARKQTLIDVVKWVNGTADFPSYRNPFSDKKLRAAGIQDANRFRQSLQPYMTLQNGNLTFLDVQALHRHNPDAYMRLYTLIDNQARRCITQGSVGNTPLLKESSPFWKVFFQFKDFTMRATHSQSVRSAVNHEVDDVMNFAFSTATNLGVVYGLAQMRANIKYGDDEAKKQKYLKDYSDPKKAIMAGMLRSTTGSALSSANDLFEALGVSPLPTIRTTVSRYENPNVFQNPDEAVGNMITQLPAIKTALDMGITGINMVQPMIDKNDRFSQQEISKALSLMPLQNSLLGLKLKQELMGSDMVKKQPKRDQKRK